MFLSASYIQGFYSSGQKIILLIFCLLFTVSLRAVRSAEEIKSVKADQILDTKQFNYLDKEVSSHCKSCFPDRIKWCLSR